MTLNRRLVGIFVLCLVVPVPASAYVRTSRTPGAAVLWKANAIELWLKREGLPETVQADEALLVLQAAAAAWSFPEIPCTSLGIKAALLDKGEARIGSDGINLVVMHRTAWCESGVKKVGACYSSERAAVTTIHTDDDDKGIEILDADIELNGVDYAWEFDNGEVSLPRNGMPRATLNFRAVLVHELGHVLGFEHSCARGASRLKDEAGRAVPLCDVPPSVGKETVMAPVEYVGEFGSTKLFDDDRRGLCTVYPRKMSNRHAPCSCSVRMPSGDASTGIACGLLALLLARRTSRRTSPNC